MNTLHRTLSCALLLGASTSAIAASTTDLTVRGLITPSACAPTLSDGGVIDYGKIAAKDLKQTDITFLEHMDLSLDIHCEAPTAMALQFVDNRSGTSSNPSYPGLGLTPAGEKIGFLTPYLQDPRVDNTAVQMSESQDHGATWKKAYTYTLRGLYAPSALADASQPIPSTRFSARLGVIAAIEATDSLTLTSEVPFEGNVTLEARYL
ncbi:DUF1120 domain-containing protein [Pseudomonas lurida]|uniref:DUF1120 domain-containing protein n=1 Tax=Pseudomonas lurida TaxID=244566 RepID=A0ABY9FXU3_9PSED|nr:DUF1120 domain-containing protein [Pseudomonas lurida]MBC3239008.1 DUF1120 domain-containing protein [Pseudomonas lurida]WLH08156.1 DUF1120 domain-containing protein [Pseudomonas lurida]